MPNTPDLLTKGLEEELFTGTPDARIVGVSHLVKDELPGFRTEPDCRNTEFASDPLTCYEKLACVLMTQRRNLRDWLEAHGGLTIVPGATLATGDSSKFEISDESNAYYRHIRDTYHTRVVTASLHINVGLSDREDIVRASRLLRMEACLFLALSASSPFIDNKATGYHSTRWAKFPHTPAYVPLFEDHADYARFVTEAIEDGRMQNSRHLWISARPNGDGVPDDINRIELRICDRIDCPAAMVAATALMEARLWQMLDDPCIDPLAKCDLPLRTRIDDLMEINDANNTAAMKSSLDANVRRWEDGSKTTVREWLTEYFENARATAKARGFAHTLTPIRDILKNGNAAMRWLKLHESGATVAQVMQQAITETESAEAKHREKVCAE